MSRAALGAIFGVSATAVYKWENGICQPDIPTLMKMADLFGVTIDNLCDYKPEESNPEVGPCPEAQVAMAIRRMSPEEQQTFLNVGRVLFARAFGGEEAAPEGIPDEDEA